MRDKAEDKRFGKGIKFRRSMIDDIRLEIDTGKGPPIRFANQEFRKMFDLANLGSKDIFYDLGSGWGQSLIIAVSEYHVRQAVGIERDLERQAVSNSRLRRRNLDSRAKIVRGNFEDLYSNKLAGVSLAEPSAIFYGLTTDDELISAMRERAKPGCRLIYYFNGLFPEIKAEKVDFPFFVSRVPFKKPASEYDWLNSILTKRESSVGRGKPTVKELWDELTHDYDAYSEDTSDIAYYKKKLKEVLSS
jgi:precorrin-6B methylase 2